MRERERERERGKVECIGRSDGEELRGRAEIACGEGR
jgi:hypothetical protein